MRLPEGELSPEAHEALVACLRIAAQRGRQLRLERARAARAEQAADARADEHQEPEGEDATGAAARDAKK